jgi:ribosome-binding protein aMBF1 (putative translation factor)
MKNKANDIRKKVSNASRASSIDWDERTRFLVENEKWLDYSARITLRILARIEEKPALSQGAIARSLNMSKQQVSRILRGDQNLTLKTIAKLSDVVGFELISFPEYKDSYMLLNTHIPPLHPVPVIPLFQKVKADDFFSMTQKVSNG